MLGLKIGDLRKMQISVAKKMYKYYYYLIIKHRSKKKNCALTIMSAPPNMNIMIKSELLPRNDPSSSIRQYRYVKVILNKKLKPIVPKNRNVVMSLHT